MPRVEFIPYEEFLRYVKNADVEALQRLPYSRDYINRLESAYGHYTPLACAVTAASRTKSIGERRALAMIEYLLAQGAEINKLCEVGGNNDTTPLSVAAFQGNATIVRYLLAQGANIGAGGIQRGTAIHDAVRGGCIDTLRVLLMADRGDYINRMTVDGLTPLHLAGFDYNTSGSSKPHLVETLLEYGADRSIRKSGTGRTPEEHARHFGGAYAANIMAGRTVYLSREPVKGELIKPVAFNMIGFLGLILILNAKEISDDTYNPYYIIGQSLISLCCMAFIIACYQLMLTTTRMLKREALIINGNFRIGARTMGDIFHRAAEDAAGIVQHARGATGEFRGALADMRGTVVEVRNQIRQNGREMQQLIVTIRDELGKVVKTLRGTTEQIGDALDVAIRNAELPGLITANVDVHDNSARVTGIESICRVM